MIHMVITRKQSPFTIPSNQLHQFNPPN